MATVTIVTAGASTPQNVTIRLKSGTSVIDSVVYISKALVDIEFLTLFGAFRQNAKQNIDITIQGAAADANTTATVRNLVAISFD